MPSHTHILILEDRPEDAALMIHELRKAGLELEWERVDREVDYVAALEAAAQGQRTIDVILADFYIPQFDALRALEILREQALDIPLLVVTGTVGREAAIECMRKGAADYLLKDRLARLGTAVENALKEKRLRAAQAQISDALRESEQRYRLLAEHATDMISRHTPEGGYLYASPACRTLLGYEPEELVGRNSYALIHPQDIETVAKSHTSIMEQPIVYTVEYRLRCKDGRYVWVETTSKIINDTENGQMMEIIAITRDISERKEAERALREREATLSSIFRAAPMAIGLVVERHFLQVNDYMCKLLGYPREALIGQNARMVYPNDAVYEWVGQVKYEQIRRQGTGTVETQWLRQNGEIIDVILSSTPLDPEDHAAGVTFTAVDITERKRAEAALRASLQTSADLVQAIPAGLLIYQYEPPDTLILIEGNPAAAEQTDIDLKTAIGKTFDEIWPNARERGITEAFMSPMKTGEMYRTEELHYRDEQIEGAFRVHTFRMAKDRLGVAFENVTEQKRMEMALRESETRFRALVQNTSDVIVLLDTEGITRYISPSVEAILGYTAEVFTGKDPFAYVHPDDIAATQDKFAEAVQHPATPVLHEFRIRDAEGRWIYVETVTNNLLDTPGVQGVVINARDISERKRSEIERERLLTKIREQAQQVQQIIDTVPEGVILLDKHQRVIRANPLGEHDLQVLSNAQVGDILRQLGERPLVELLTSPPQGLWHELETDTQHYQVLARSIETGPAPGEWVLVIRDVTQQRQIENYSQQQERLAAVGHLAAGIAHDFNNIMATIVLYAQMASRSEGLSSRDQERLATINQQARHATNLIQQILDFSRRTVLERAPLDLLPLLKEQIRLLERTLPENILIDLTYGHDDYTIDADPTRIQQVVMNLALNARDAMPEGGALRFEMERITIRNPKRAPLPEMPAGEWIKVSLSDTGTGIAPDVLPHIYDPFFTTKPPGQGSGLGLSQVYGIVTHHEGFIQVNTQVGEGTTFLIYLPALPTQPSNGQSLQREDLPMGHGETLLVIEDAEATRAALVESLEMLNYRVLQAANGAEALATLQERGHEIHLVVSDVVMPEMGGIALIHAMQQANIQIQVVLLTGHPLERELEELRKEKTDALLVAWMLKPPSLEKLGRLIERGLKG